MWCHLVPGENLLKLMDLYLPTSAGFMAITLKKISNGVNIESYSIEHKKYNSLFKHINSANKKIS